MSRDAELRSQAWEEVEKHRDTVEQDPYRLRYHIMPPVGLLNDPNGFIYWNNQYHLFYQWMPFKTDHGAKFWGHYTSEDLVHWKHEEIALTPSDWFDKNGCYSGSAMNHEGKLYVFYTGNVKDENGNRETYQCLAISENGIHFEKKGPVIHLPEDYTAHFRDPKVWEQDGEYFMVVGAQTKELKGAVALFRSGNLVDWTHIGIIAGGGKGKLADFGYMFECPDMFRLGGKDILIFSPQGLEPQGMKYQNVYQAGYVVGNLENGTYEHGDFEELDRGFDFYAPQTTEDEKGRRILFAWMSVPDQNEQAHPTIKHRWLHNMTLPRELKVINGKVRQVPVEELQELRATEKVSHVVKLDNKCCELEGIKGKALELYLTDIHIADGWFEIGIAGGAARIIYSPSQKVMTLERKSYVDGLMEKRQCFMERLDSLHIYLDTSSIEMFVNGGEETFTARYYPNPYEENITFGTVGKCEFMIEKWSLQS